MTKTIIFISLTSLFISSCAKICVVAPIRTTLNNHEVVFAESKMPCKKVADFNKAVDLTIKAIFSDEFEKQLDNFIKDSIGTGEYAKAWEGLKAFEIVKRMREQINGTYADTYGGIRGVLLFVFFHNIAFDGTGDGPILLNRIPLKKRTAASIANTIAHELSHRVGLTHPHSNTNLKVAYKEPPYIVGDIIERIIESMTSKSN